MTNSTPQQAKGKRWHVLLAWFQGIYYVITGIWPFFSISSFMAVTGPKTDIWLVKTVGLLLVVNGIVLMLYGYHRRMSSETVVLAIGTALALLSIEVFFTLSGTIQPIYLLDAAVEGLLIVCWLRVAAHLRRSACL